MKSVWVSTCTGYTTNSLFCFHARLSLYYRIRKLFVFCFFFHQILRSLIQDSRVSVLLCSFPVSAFGGVRKPMWLFPGMHEGRQTATERWHSHCQPGPFFLLAQTLAGGLSACVVCVNMAALLTNERRCRSSARLPLLPGARSDASGCSVPKIALQDGVQLAVMAWVFL